MSGRHYLDHASTSPLRPEACTALSQLLTEDLGDPGRQHEEGRVAREAVENARSEIASLFGVRERQIVFTSSGTEAVNTANESARAAGDGAIACAAVEHSAVRLSAERLGTTTVLAVDSLGRIEVDAVEDLLRRGDRPALVHCQYANHEVATLQPVKEIVTLCREADVAVHVDACAGAGQVPLDLGELGADSVSISADKFGGPPGVGALVVRRDRRLSPLLVGGEQERGRRAGFENVHGIVAFGAVACALRAPGAIAEEQTRARRRTEALLNGAKGVDGVIAYGDTVERLAHIICLGVAGVEAEGVVLGLDQLGVAVHSGSACTSESFEPSAVLEAMGVDADRSLRCSVGWSSTDDDVDAFLAGFASVVAALRALHA